MRLNAVAGPGLRYQIAQPRPDTPSTVARDHFHVMALAAQQDQIVQREIQPGCADHPPGRFRILTACLSGEVVSGRRQRRSGRVSRADPDQRKDEGEEDGLDGKRHYHAPKCGA